MKNTHPIPSHPIPFLSFPFLSFPFLSFPFLSFPFLSFVGRTGLLALSGHDILPPSARQARYAALTLTVLHASERNAPQDAESKTRCFVPRSAR
ncbi:MAG: hypothetical protein M3R45_10790 [Pseudomonadota bacterium]|nr:hypothetical protein [Pseudomonadota bacterium]